MNQRKPAFLSGKRTLPLLAGALFVSLAALGALSCGDDDTDPYCGDGIVQYSEGEMCDDGRDNGEDEGDRCNSSCRFNPGACTFDLALACTAGRCGEFVAFDSCGQMALADCGDCQGDGEVCEKSRCVVPEPEPEPEADASEPEAEDASESGEDAAAPESDASNPEEESDAGEDAGDAGEEDASEPVDSGDAGDDDDASIPEDNADAGQPDASEEDDASIPDEETDADAPAEEEDASEPEPEMEDAAG